MPGTAFRTFGPGVTEATNVEEAVQAARDGHSDAMVLDIGMPLMNGWEATKLIL